MAATALEVRSHTAERKKPALISIPFPRTNADVNHAMQILLNDGYAERRYQLQAQNDGTYEQLKQDEWRSQSGVHAGLLDEPITSDQSEALYHVFQTMGVPGEWKRNIGHAMFRVREGASALLRSCGVGAKTE
ncbi:MAG: hypothetical protein PHE68_03570 [Candidatus Peribacteraceae bacterium]|nr:hypothetical protein [Candidatus Peribacteraceae bacterium]MDD5074700.1 hypothetical protein [Candidatus Peribacteraceae bacterium]